MAPAAIDGRRGEGVLAGLNPVKTLCMYRDLRSVLDAKFSDLSTRPECRSRPNSLGPALALRGFASSVDPEKGAARTYRLELSSAVLSVFNFVSIRKSYDRKTPIGFIGFPAVAIAA